jgi:hypothetical protein
MAGLVLTTCNLMIVHIGDASIVNIPSNFRPLALSGISCQPISFAWYLVMSVRVELGGKKA